MTAPSLARKTFTISRLSEFASTAELVKATGHPVERWPLVIVKELIDNAIDAAEGANVAPVVDVAVKATAASSSPTGSGHAARARRKSRRLLEAHVEPGPLY
jgi:DNA topoisomerase VI subunit B